MTCRHAHELTPTPGARRVRALVAAGDGALRRAARDALAGHAGIVVVADAPSELEALELVRWYRPEVVLADRSVAISAILAAARCAVVVLAPDADDGPAGLRALRAGARGVVSLPRDASTLADCVRAVAEGDVAVSPRLVMALVERLRALPEPGGLRPVRSALTAREWEVLDLLASGAGTQEIAETLQIARETVYGHVKRILRKLGVRSRQEAVSAARALRAPIGA